jgi:hypothetical protein
MTTAVRPETKATEPASRPVPRLGFDEPATKPTRSPLIVEVAKGHKEQSALNPTQAAPKPFSAGKLLCYIRIHRGDWSYVRPRACAQVRRCSCCEAVSSRQKHTYDWTWAAPGTCAQRKVCQTCGGQDGTRVRHNWSEWAEFGLIGNERRQCARCERSESRSVSAEY